MPLASGGRIANNGDACKCVTARGQRIYIAEVAAEQAADCGTCGGRVQCCTRVVGNGPKLARIFIDGGQGRAVAGDRRIVDAGHRQGDVPADGQCRGGAGAAVTQVAQHHSNGFGSGRVVASGVTERIGQHGADIAQAAGDGDAS